MASNSRYRVPFQRRRKGLTDYQQRLELLKSGKPRFVVRTTNRHIQVQVVTPGDQGDETKVSSHSAELEDYGWLAPTTNTPAAYLVGHLAGIRSLSAGLDELVLDKGLHDVTPGNKVFAALMGGVDAGLDIPHSEDVLPSWERVRGEHIAEYVEYSDREIEAEELPEHFDEVLESMEEEA